MSSFNNSEPVSKGLVEDEFDLVLNLEAEAYESGHQDGIEAARMGESFEEGRKAGYFRGLALGLEFGFLESVCESLVEKNGDSQSGKRSVKRQTEILSRIKDIPLQNVETLDFDSELRDLRGLYKQCNGNIGSFQRPKVSSLESSLW